MSRSLKVFYGVVVVLVALGVGVGATAGVLLPKLDKERERAEDAIERAEVLQSESYEDKREVAQLDKRVGQLEAKLKTSDSKSQTLRDEIAAAYEELSDAFAYIEELEADLRRPTSFTAECTDLSSASVQDVLTGAEPDPCRNWSITGD